MADNSSGCLVKPSEIKVENVDNENELNKKPIIKKMADDSFECLTKPSEIKEENVDNKNDLNKKNSWTANNFAECFVKSEFLSVQQSQNENVKPENGSNEAESKKKARGRNHDRPPPLKFSKSDKLCPTLNKIKENEEEVKCTFPNCAFQHDTAKYLQNKPLDISEECHAFKTFGICDNGLSCRFGKMHIKDDKYNMINPEIYKDGITARSQEKNHIPRELKESLRKKKYDFKTTDQIVDRVYKTREDKKECQEPEAKKIKIIEEPQLEKSEIKRKIDWNDKLYLAPLTTVGNLPFRRICKKLGAEF